MSKRGFAALKWSLSVAAALVSATLVLVLETMR